MNSNSENYKQPDEKESINLGTRPAFVPSNHVKYLPIHLPCNAVHYSANTNNTLFKTFNFLPLNIHLTDSGYFSIGLKEQFSEPTIH